MPTKQIDEFTFELQPLTAWKGLRAFHQFTTLMGPAVGGLIAIAGAKKTGDAEADKGLAAAMLLKTIPEALRNSTPEAVEALARVVLDGALVKVAGGKLGALDPVLDTLLQGRLLTFLTLIVWACEVHFGGFFGELVKGWRERSTSQGPATSSSTSPTTSATSGQPGA